jgi:hypothetical protein
MRALLILLLVASAAHADPADLVKDLPACDKDRAHCFGIQLHVTPDLFDAAFIAEQLEAANRHFARLGVAFQIVGADALPASGAHIATRGERDELSIDRLKGTVIHVFLIGKLDDIDEPGSIAHGVTWHRRNDDHKYILVSNNSKPRTLAHELGHFFGLPHSTYAISIMNKTTRTEPPTEKRTFADEEIAAMRPKLKQLVADKVIADLPR